MDRFAAQDAQPSKSSCSKGLFQRLFAQIAEERGDLAGDLILVWSRYVDLYVLTRANSK